MNVHWALLCVSSNVSILMVGITVHAAGGMCLGVLATAQVC